MLSYLNKYCTLPKHGEQRNSIRFLNNNYETNGEIQTLERIIFLRTTSGKRDDYIE